MALTLLWGYGETVRAGASAGEAKLWKKLQTAYDEYLEGTMILSGAVGEVSRTNHIQVTAMGRIEFIQGQLYNLDTTYYAHWALVGYSTTLARFS